MGRRGRRLAVLLGIALELAAAGTARADWPMARHDPQRTGAAAGKGDIQKPAVKWRHYLGGSIPEQNLLFADADGDGQGDILLSTGGRITAVRLDDSHIWEVSALGYATLLGLFDLDGDGRKEVVTYVNQGVHVYDLATGAPVWIQPPSEMGATQLARVGDMNGDGRPDVVVGECRGCGGGKTQTGFIYAFPNGFGAPQRIPLPYPDASAGPEMVVADMDGKGGAEVLIASPGTQLHAIDGATGNIVATSPDLGIGSLRVNACLPQELDGAPGLEVVCIASPSLEPTPGANDGSKVFALKLAGGALQVLWTFAVPPSEALSSGYNDLGVDLDGDAVPEVVVTGRDVNGGYTTHILRATTGAELTPIAGQRYQGSATSLPGGRRAIFTSSPGAITTWEFDATAPQKLVSHGAIKSDYVTVAPDWARIPISSAGTFAPLAIDLNGDGASEVVTLTSEGSIAAYSVVGNAPVQLGLASFPPEEPLIALWPMPAGGAAQLGVAQSNGVLSVLDAGLGKTVATVRFGGHYAPGGYNQLGLSPVAGALGGGMGQRVLAVDSRKSLLQIDASAAGEGTPPIVTWEQPHSYAPVVMSSPSGPLVASIQYDATKSPVAFTLRALRPDGSPLWQVPIESTPPSDIVPADFDGDGSPDLALQAGQTGAAVVSTYAISGKDGHTMWKTPVTGCGLPSGVSVADWNGDGVDDVVQHTTGIHVLEGKAGTEIAYGGPADCYYLPIPIDTDGDGLREVVLQAGYSPASLYAHDLATKLYAGTEDDRPYPYGAIAECAEGPVLVEGSLAFPSRLKITKLAGADLGGGTAVFLGGGAVHADQASAEAAFAGQLTAANVHEDLTGAGHPTVVVGSIDGWLYGLDACTGALDFSYNFNAPVGEPVFGDTDGDGLDEILVTVADGYLYSLKNDAPGDGGGGAGGGGSGGGGAGGSSHHRRAEYLLYGRAGCYCEAAGERGEPGPRGGLALAAGALAAIGRVRRRRAAARCATTGPRPRGHPSPRACPASTWCAPAAPPPVEIAKVA